MQKRSLFPAIGLGLCALVWSLSPAGAAGAPEAVLAELSADLANGRYQDAISLANAGLAEPGLSDVARARLMAARGMGHQALSANEDALADFTQALSVAVLPVQEQAHTLFARGLSLDSLG